MSRLHRMPAPAACSFALGTEKRSCARNGDRVPGAAYVAADLMAATSWLLAESGHPEDDA